MTASYRVYLSLGSNIEREANVNNCLDTLADRFGELCISSVYESESVGFRGDPFFNLVVSMRTTQAIDELSTTLRQIEYGQGRERHGAKFSGRTLDIDILLFDDLWGDFDGIQLPRPEITENAYVLWPLAEIAGELVLPGTQLRIAELWDGFDKLKQRLKPVSFTWGTCRLPNLPKPDLQGGSTSSGP
jgi:2-amino-4-hydroxy-6-hydroxymethyldihydropteridine diphosphokinase